MSRLQTLSFDQGGMLDFDANPDEPEIGPYYSWKLVEKLLKLKKQDLSTPACMDCLQPCSTSKEYFMSALKRLWPRIEDATLDEDDEHNGRRHIMETILTSKPFDTSIKPGDKKETFVLRHNDLNFRNILCDVTGRVTAILDCDECCAVPRCFGYSSVPVKSYFPSR
jgi:aminoglycoside phosphotransferase (APT) family kinase protein